MNYLAFTHNNPSLIIKTNFISDCDKIDLNLIILNSLNQNSLISKIRINLMTKSITLYSPYFNTLLNYLSEIDAQLAPSVGAFRVQKPKDLKKLSAILLDTHTFPVRYRLFLLILATEGVWALKQNNAPLLAQKLL